MKKTGIRRLIAGVLSLLMIMMTVFTGDVALVRAAGEKYGINLQMTLATDVDASGYGFDYTIKDESGNAVDSGFNSSVSLSDIPSGYSMEVKTITAGKQIWANGSAISGEEQASWEAGKIITIDRNIEYSFQLNNPAGRGGRTFSINFGSSSWTVGETNVTVDRSGTEVLGENDEISLTNFNPETMEVRISETIENPFSTTLTVVDGKTKLANKNCDNLPDGPFIFSVQSSRGGSGSTPPGPVEHPEKIKISIEEGAELLDAMTATIVDGQTAVDGIYTVEQAEQHGIEFQVEYGKTVSKVIVNNTEYIAVDMGLGKIKVTVPDSVNVDEGGAKIYSVKLVEGDSDDVTIVWAYDKTEAEAHYGGVDSWVNHGRVEVVSIKRAGSNVTEGIDVNDKGGYIQIKKGDDVTLRLIPDYGYQLASATVNGQTFVAQENVSEFNLPNIQGNLHFSGAFVEVRNEFDVRSSLVDRPDIINGQNAASSGNLKLTVADNAGYTTDVTSKVNGEGVTQLGSIDLTLDNLVSKGTEGDYWTQNLTNFGQNIDIAFNIDFSRLSEGEEFSVVRDHEGNLEELPVNMDPEHNMIAFSTNQFSTYTIVKKVALQPDITDDMWIWDPVLEKYKYVIDDSHPGDQFRNIYVPSDKVLIIAKDYEITGNLTVDIFGTLKIEKGCHLTKRDGANIDMRNLSTIVLGDESSRDLFAPLKVKKTGHQELLDFVAPAYNIDNTEFILIDGNYIYYDGPDSGFTLNTNGTIVPKDEMGNDLPRRGYIEYKVTTDGEVVAEGELLNDWDEVNILPEKFKIGTLVEFTVHVNEGYILQTNGVRFPNNKNTISNREDERNRTIYCSYILNETPSGFLGLTVDFIEPGQELRFAEFYWSYDSDVTKTEDGWDKYIEHGKVEIVSVTKDGVPVNNGSIENPPYWSTGDSYEIRNENGITWNEKVALLEEGTTVVARLIPDRGYQLTRFNISDIAKSTKAVDGVNEYTFYINRPDYYHLSAVFSPVSDTVDLTGATGISGGSVSFANDEVANGTMALNVSDVTPDAVEMNKFNSMAEAGGYEVAQCLNLESEQRFYKAVENATREQCWVVNKSELNSPATITLNVNVNNADVIVLHNHNGVYEEIPATYSDGKLTFAAQSFSDFAIASKAEGKPVPPVKVEQETKQEEEPYAPRVNPLGKTPTGTVINNWNDMKNYLGTVPALKTKQGKTKNPTGPVVELILNNINTTIPADVFKALGQSNARGLHVFLGHATALTFMNDKRITNQDSVDVACVTSTNAKSRTKTIAFRNYKKLNTSVLLHTVVPKGTKNVTVYFTGRDGNRRKVGTFMPTAEGRMCFSITELGKYEIEY